MPSRLKITINEKIFYAIYRDIKNCINKKKNYASRFINNSD